MPGGDFIALRAFLRAVVALQTAVEDLWAAVRQRALQKRALERSGVKDAPQEAQNLLRADARSPILLIVKSFQFAPLRRGIFLLSRIVVIEGHRYTISPERRSSASARSSSCLSAHERGTILGWARLQFSSSANSGPSSRT
jgi:hypothetical protein